jgi:hypothetical protein
MVSGSYLRPEFLNDRVRVHYHLQKPYGIPDEDGVKEVLYSEVKNLPPPRMFDNLDAGYWSEEILVPAIGETITFIFYSFAETDHGPNEHVMYGPYRKV